MSTGFALDDAAWASPWRRRAVGEKVLLAGGLVGVGISLPVWPGSVLAAAAALAILLGPAQVSPRVLARSVAAPLAFIVVGSLSVLVSLRWDGGPGVAVTEETRRSALSVLGHGTAGTLGVLVIAATTPMADLLGALRRLRVPDACIDVAGLVYRLVLVLLATVVQMGEAQAARLGYRDRRTTLRSSAALGAGLLVRSWDRARRLEEGLAGRGYTGSLPSLDPPRRTSLPFVATSLVALGAITTAALTMGGS
ncbi:cobalt ECF transporter T component CbiQ [Intrasporangium calvum]|uniref:Cobalt ABC transporter, inner membrane subunit CbiQ n=1 Tax=Intrasporangium calvum (strain ATCC 23552 / DSM 43043 / JCM 3097 / NBRC 12989 / NCIMB 10167 / NRRL B-3866 / 7 KIP) TaxID=710696 RepID=E6SBL1_INTC7|nr:cobalt ECF transporter T component CbiQ [Intrasporangium calvum]ADU47342.1 cobalt ABC transporter, inner membrane subunit CbiQ [Intrasporangium calvum DSM 43043]